MTVFSYRAINEDGKEVRGSIDATDLEAAKKAVEDLHLEVVDVSEATRNRDLGGSNPKPDDQGPAPTTFAFEGTDSAGTVRRGTIQAPTKKDAFLKLRADQKLALVMLAPMGTLPKYNDPDLRSWQKSPDPSPSTPIAVQHVQFNAPIVASPNAAPQPVAAKVKPTLRFTPPVIPGDQKAPPPNTDKASTASHEKRTYHSITATLRLYAGWLLAWYGLFVAIGYYATVRTLPWDIPFVRAFYVSPLIFSFTVGIFLFLLLSTIHRSMKGRLILGTLLTLVGVGGFIGVRLSL